MLSKAVHHRRRSIVRACDAARLRAHGVRATCAAIMRRCHAPPVVRLGAAQVAQVVAERGQRAQVRAEAEGAAAVAAQLHKGLLARNGGVADLRAAAAGRGRAADAQHVRQHLCRLIWLVRPGASREHSKPAQRAQQAPAPLPAPASAHRIDVTGANDALLHVALHIHGGDHGGRGRAAGRRRKLSDQHIGHLRAQSMRSAVQSRCAARAPCWALRRHASDDGLLWSGKRACADVATTSIATSTARHIAGAMETASRAHAVSGFCRCVSQTRSNSSVLMIRFGGDSTKPFQKISCSTRPQDQ